SNLRHFIFSVEFFEAVVSARSQRAELRHASSSPASGGLRQPAQSDLQASGSSRFEFNLMVVGETGLGKSTLLNSLFSSELYNSDHPGPSKRIKKTVCVESHTV
ncbi:hypothetical protein BOX15_Mlig010642g3, partial [Macrostomum lignano]